MEFSIGYIFLSVFSAVSLLLCVRVILKESPQTEPYKDFRVVIYYIIILDLVEFFGYQALAFGYVQLTEMLAGAFLMVGTFFVSSLLVYSIGLAKNPVFEKYKAALFLPSFILVYLHSQGQIVSGFTINQAGMLHEDGPLAYLYDAFMIGVLVAIPVTLTLYSRSSEVLLASRSRLMLWGLIPLVLTIVLALLVPMINISVVLPMLTIYLLISLEYISGSQVINLSGGMLGFAKTFGRISRGFTTSEITLGEYKDIVEREFISHEIQKGGSINDIAERLDIHSTTFRNKLKKYGIKVPLSNGGVLDKSG